MRSEDKCWLVVMAVVVLAWLVSFGVSAWKQVELAKATICTKGINA